MRLMIRLKLNVNQIEVILIPVMPYNELSRIKKRKASFFKYK